MTFLHGGQLPLAPVKRIGALNRVAARFRLFCPPP